MTKLNIKTALVEKTKENWKNEYDRKVTNTDISDAINRWLEENLPFN